MPQAPHKATSPTRKPLQASETDDTTTIKLTENYRNNRTTYKLNSRLFSETTAQRFMFYFFTDPHFLITILARQTSGTFGFNHSGKADALAKPKINYERNT